MTRNDIGDFAQSIYICLILSILNVFPVLLWVQSLLFGERRAFFYLSFDCSATERIKDNGPS